MPDDPPHRAGPSVKAFTPYEPSAPPSTSGSGARVAVRRRVVRATPWVRLEAAAVTARGRARRVNEDCHSPLEAGAPLFVVADGVGGGAMAARASRELVAQLHASLDQRRIDAPAIREALLRADRAVGDSIAAQTRASGAATVALAAGCGSDLASWWIGWVGDCRVYRASAARADPAELLTVDDTYRALREAPPPGGSRDDPARMVGNGAVVEPNVGRAALGDGEMLVLCSDGVHKHVDAADIGRILRGAGPLARRCWKLVALARTRGSTDDATVLVVHRSARRSRARLALGAIVLVGLLLAAIAASLVVTL